MRNLQELHERHNSQSHRSFYISPATKSQAYSNKQMQPSLNEIKAIFSKQTKLDMLVNPYSDRKSSINHQKSISNKFSVFQTPIPNPQKTSFIINKATRQGASFFEKKDKPSKPFVDQSELRKFDYIKAKEQQRIPSPLTISEGFII